MLVALRWFWSRFRALRAFRAIALRVLFITSLVAYYFCLHYSQRPQSTKYASIQSLKSIFCKKLAIFVKILLYSPNSLLNFKARSFTYD